MLEIVRRDGVSVVSQIVYLLLVKVAVIRVHSLTG